MISDDLAAGPAELRRVDRLDAADARAVLALADRATLADGVAPLSEHVLLNVRAGAAADAVHLVVGGGGADVAGYAFVDRSDAAGAVVELVVDPARRRHGLGRALVAAAERLAPAGRLSCWAHGDLAAARALAGQLGLVRTRVLWQLRRPLTGPGIPQAALPAGVALRAFRPGVDDAAWLAVNARAFAHHPEQGRWTADDLRARFAEDWFDPAGFLLAVDVDDRLLGFHWTKVHPARAGQPARGEVYVLGVDPGGHRRGLGAALTAAGLRHLRERGLTEVLLYVDESNRAAVALYRRLGFTEWAADVTYERPA